MRGVYASVHWTRDGGLQSTRTRPSATPTRRGNTKAPLPRAGEGKERRGGAAVVDEARRRTGGGFQAGVGVQLVQDDAGAGEDVADLDAARRRGVGDEAPVAAPGDGFGAHHDGRRGRRG